MLTAWHVIRDIIEGNTAFETGSVVMSAWCLLLVQAAFVFVPGAPAPSPGAAGEDDAFERAHRSAEAALRKISVTT